MQAAKAYRLLRAVLNTAVADDLLVRNPCRLPGAGQEHSPERPLATPQQVLALADAIDQRYRALVLLAATGGLRLGELLGLRRSHVDLRAGTVRVEEQATQMMSGARLIGPPKSAAGKRTVALPVLAVEALTRHVEAFVGTDDEAYVFNTPAGAPLDKATLYRSWRAARTEVGLDHVTLHDLRHAGATLAAWTGASTKELMARLGHSSARAALRYQHAASSRDQEIARRLDAVFADARDGRAMETNGTSAQIEDQGLDLGL
jgi:integrase